MPARLIVTARQERLGVELRMLRERAGLTVRDAARDLSIDQTKISHMEAGRVGVSEERLRRLAAHYACDDHRLVDALARMAKERHRGWWESYRNTLPAGFLDLAELEHHATSLSMLSVVSIPGLLQTADYARSMFAYTVPELSSSELEARVEHRMQRKNVLNRANPPKFIAVVHEAALRIMVADRRTTVQQLESLLEDSTSGHVVVKVVPFTAEWFAGAGYSMLHVGGPVPKLDTIQLDSPGSAGYLYAEAQLNKYRATLQKITKSVTLSEAASRDLIHRLTKER